MTEQAGQLGWVGALSPEDVITLRVHTDRLQEIRETLADEEVLARAFLVRLKRQYGLLDGQYEINHETGDIRRVAPPSLDLEPSHVGPNGTRLSTVS